MHDEVDAILKLTWMKENKWQILNLDHLINPEIPFWGHLYILVRMGRIQEGFDYIYKFAKRMPPKDKPFVNYYRAWMESDDGKLPRELQGNLTEN